MTHRKTPQQKKALSYQKDRRNAYGENDKASRRIIPLRKRKATRSYRKQANQILSKFGYEKDADYGVQENAIKTIKKKRWKKVPDRPLGEHVSDVIESRRYRHGRKKRIADWLKAREGLVEQGTSHNFGGCTPSV